MPSLDGPQIKLDRAREHLRLLDEEIQTFLRSEPRPYGGVREIDPVDGSHVWRFKVYRTPPPRLGVLVGDVVHNQRAALDHLIWQLALTSTSRPRSSIQFPIYRSRTPSSRGEHAFDPHGIKQMGGVPPAAQSIIEAKQPYHAPNPEHTPIWLLHTLDIEDKHRIIPVVDAVLPQGIYALPGEVFDDPGTVPFQGGTLNDGTELLRVSRQMGARIQEHGEPRFAFNIALSGKGPASTYPVWEILSNIDRAIREDVFHPLAPFVTGGHP